MIQIVYEARHQRVFFLCNIDMRLKFWWVFACWNVSDAEKESRQSWWCVLFHNQYSGESLQYLVSALRRKIPTSQPLSSSFSPQVLSYLTFVCCDTFGYDKNSGDIRVSGAFWHTPCSTSGSRNNHILPSSVLYDHPAGFGLPPPWELCAWRWPLPKCIIQTYSPYCQGSLPSWKHSLSIFTVSTCNGNWFSAIFLVLL
jgi:hypothetical protein